MLSCGCPNLNRWAGEVLGGIDDLIRRPRYANHAVSIKYLLGIYAQSLLHNIMEIR